MSFRLFINVSQYGALNLPIYRDYVGHPFLPTTKYTNYSICPGFFNIFLINSPIKLILSIFRDVYVFYLSGYSFKRGYLYITLFCTSISSKSGISLTFSIFYFLRSYLDQSGTVPSLCLPLFCCAIRLEWHLPFT